MQRFYNPNTNSRPHHPWITTGFPLRTFWHGNHRKYLGIRWFSGPIWTAKRHQVLCVLLSPFNIDLLTNSEFYLDVCFLLRVHLGTSVHSYVNIGLKNYCRPDFGFPCEHKFPNVVRSVNWSCVFVRTPVTDLITLRKPPYSYFWMPDSHRITFWKPANSISWTKIPNYNIFGNRCPQNTSHRFPKQFYIYCRPVFNELLIWKPSSKV